MKRQRDFACISFLQTNLLVQENELVTVCIVTCTTHNTCAKHMLSPTFPHFLFRSYSTNLFSCVTEGKIIASIVAFVKKQHLTSNFVH